MNARVCSKCGRPPVGTPLVLVSESLEQIVICPACAAADHASTIHTIEEADHFIAEATDQLRILEKVISQQPKMPDVPPELQAVSMSPLSVYQTLQTHLAAFNSRRMELMTLADSEQVLQYEICKAIETEDFERAAMLKSRLSSSRERESG
ncbi:MAG: hypothetical protein R3C53_00705 [Pirellulaceae bacterium]